MGIFNKMQCTVLSDKLKIKKLKNKKNPQYKWHDKTNKYSHIRNN